VGASGLFLENAKKMDVEIADVDFLVISHGHYDHGGGLESFFKKKDKAKVFKQKKSFQKQYYIR
jgi:7,8-dihydropterin-6-yl-methyl-4-(beta-D-ribofuranosyl)aminobenzene 5'-phosphate synthase